MDARQMALEKVPQAIQIRFSFPPYPGAELKTIAVDLPEGALLLDAIRQCRLEHHVPVYLEHSFLSTAQSLIQEARRAAVDQEIKRVNQAVFAKDASEADSTQQGQTRKNDAETQQEDSVAELEQDLALQRAIIANYRSYTSQFYTQPEENLFPEAYHTLVHSPIPSLFDAILDLEREYAGEVDALLTARDKEINDIQTKHNNALSTDTPQRNLTHLMTRHIERMEVAQAMWNSQLDDLQSAQRSKYQEFILELYAIYKRRQLQLDHGASKDDANGTLLLDGKDMVAEAMRTIGARRSNIEGASTNQDIGNAASENNKNLPATPPPQPETVAASSQFPQEPNSAGITALNPETAASSEPPPKPPRKEEDVELNRMVQSILEMGFDVEQAKGALLIANRNMDHAINLLLEQPENIPRLVLAKQKVEAMKESARRQNRAQSSPQQPLPSLTGSNNANTAPNPAPAQDPRAQAFGRPVERSSSVSSPRPLIGGLTQGVGGFFQQQRNALLTNNTNPSVKKFGGWLNKAIENLGLDDDFDDSASRNSANSYNSPYAPAPPPVSNLDESFTVVLGSSHSKVTHNFRLMVSDPAEVFPSNRVKTEQDAAIHAQTASSLYGQNLTGLVQLVNIRDWAKYKGGQACHQEFFKACRTSTELHFDSIEKQLEALEDEFPLDGSTLREGDFVLTRHSNLPMIHVVFHLFYGQLPPQPSNSDSPSASTPTSAPHQPPMFSQSNDFSPKPDFLSGLRNIIRTAHRYEITMLSLPFLMMPTAFEQQLVASSAPEAAGPSRHHRHNSHYGSPSLSAVSTSSGASSPSSSSVASLSTAATSNSSYAYSGGGHGGPVYYITDQTRRDLQRRSESLLRHLKSFLMDNAREVKQVGNQGSEAEKFRASQGGDVKVVQFLLPKGTSDEMFRAFRTLLINIFGGA
ncbi:hypothetical protein BC939DRAFT_451068 [Gamsiella multidivaricata]|uniref:uncharacterized protein n=1 Tax=Gamsiella multidivaricata TaxID=101098 RepID=UPI0022210346|nr:uncharacterized protein BC939DRAFT_451068 [Gamsiella multidivaricata]KAG0367270.1 hypothetical protein BGZ54_004129 [Gamsiella multidivaricata]KAI7823856.1 hypothetical protein BC939DRAFT_451068 [Gamsiella multidivaricata]